VYRYCDAFTYINEQKGNKVGQCLNIHDCHKLQAVLIINQSLPGICDAEVVDSFHGKVELETVLPPGHLT